MAIPSTLIASAGATDAAGAWSYTFTAPSAAGNILILQFLADGTAAGVPTISSTTNIVNLDGTSGTWTRITAAAGEDVGSAKAASQHLYICRSASTSAPVVTGANSGGDDVYVRGYEIFPCSTGTTLAEVIENGTAGAIVNTAGTSNTASAPTVTTLGPDRLVLAFGAINDDNTSVSFTGETGGDWFQDNFYATATGTDGALFQQSANMVTAGTISGGTENHTDSDAWGVIGFGLIGTTPTPPATREPHYPAIVFQDPAIV